MNEPINNPSTESDLEARIVSMVLNEASDFERDQLERLLQQRPDLAAFKARMEDVHGLLHDLRDDDSIDAGDDWKLPLERRDQVMAVIRGEADPLQLPPIPAPAADSTLSVLGARGRRQVKVASVFGVLASIAAVGLVAFVSTSLISDSEVAVSDRVLNRQTAETADAILVPSIEADVRLEMRADDRDDYSVFGNELDHLSRDAKDNVPLENLLPDIKERLDAATTQLPASNRKNSMSYFSDVTPSGETLPPSVASVPLGERFGRERRLPDSSVVPQPTRNESPSQPPVDSKNQDAQPFPNAKEDDPFGVDENQRRHFERGETEQNQPASPPDAAWDVAGSAGGGMSGGKGFANGSQPMPPTPLEESLNRSPQQARPALRTTRETVAPVLPSAPSAGSAGNDKADAPKTAPTTDDESLLALDFSGYAGAAANKSAPLKQAPAEVEFKSDVLRQLTEEQAKPKSLDDRVAGLPIAPKEEANLGLPSPANVASEKQAAGTLPTRFDGLGSNVWQSPIPSVPKALNETLANEESTSTFSLHVSDVSFKLAQSALSQGEWPEPSKVRIEEFVNAFDYGDPLPSESEKIACQIEQSVHPFIQQRNLLRVAMRTAAAGRSNNTPLRLTLLLDNSGSMERHDRHQTVQRAFTLLAQQLKPIDQVTLISFARQPRLLADKVTGDQAGQLMELVESLPSEGGTNIEAALQLAGEKALEQKIEGAQNRIVLLTDGAVNLGNANPERLSNQIVELRNFGIAFDAAGISAEGLNDEVLEAMTRKGDGRYYLLDNLESADEGFARQLAGALRPSAMNVKVQVDFNPQRVGRYKLLGFEKHLLDKEDFRDDSVDAAEMSAEEAGVAMYQFEAKPDGQGDVGSVSVRFRDMNSGQMVEKRWPILYQPDAPHTDQATPSMQIATAASLLAAKLKGDPLGANVDLKSLTKLVSELPEPQRDTKRVVELQEMIQQARQVNGE
ncbi:von Willebrand factor [Roseimaritima multifibrata]|uniref:von Willebrand factor n=1 Tax=Roseimaritima multifibrata TaxID=1930274 RepID=A0A517MGK1_9BACT|nr:von Willebrand factor type A domain-containing protein [Roseimaritima multifibrata]QDS94014.1 von Willebrand factor [Roseimaritima multifibrata]